ncbi:hypothetical protein MSAN_01165100 [Mycena sanguinolenta]|uniref:Uncharacterized protein n=1 Tax=Mycena sanguinolenta TaxID=230812 RepID=A0A8H6YNY0_9AGAR|nr:hypothetical protein MSAN_01165100 [Mycena sanguinolenta]
MSSEHTARKRPVHDEHEDAWEDVEIDSKSEILDDIVEEDASVTRPRSPARGAISSRTSPRKRRFKAAVPSPRKVPPAKAKMEVLPTEHIWSGGLFVVMYILDVLKMAIQLLRRPLSFLVFLWMFAFVLHRISHTLKAAFSPLCYIPGISNSALCLPDGYGPASDRSSKWADYPTLVDVQSATLDQLLDESTSGSVLALKIKKAEMATTDLVTLVRVSDLKSRDMLGDALRQFVDDARVAGRALNKLNAKVAGAVDGIMAVNDYALKTIEAAQTQSPPSILGQLVPWTSKPKPNLVLSTFEDSMNYLSFAIQGLVLEFELNLRNLDKLEEQLSVLHELVSREDISVSSAKSELLGELWTKLLKGLTEYRKQALVHVVSALQTLTQMSEDIENLRERVAAPELAGSRIPVEVHIRSIQNGLDRVKESRMKAKVRESEALKRIIGADTD